MLGSYQMGGFIRIAGPQMTYREYEIILDFALYWQTIQNDISQSIYRASKSIFKTQDQIQILSFLQYDPVPQSDLGHLGSALELALSEPRLARVDPRQPRFVLGWLGLVYPREEKKKDSRFWLSFRNFVWIEGLLLLVMWNL